MTETNSIPSPARVWIEKTIVRNRLDRIEGSNRLGQALWSPQKSSDGRDVYANMRDVQSGDIVLHFVNNEMIFGISRAAATFDDTFVGLEGTDWAGQPAYRIQLRDFHELKPSLDREWIFKDDAVAEEAKAIAREPRGREIFFNENLELNQGAYLTEATPRLVALINKIYLQHTGRSVPGLAKVAALAPTDTALATVGPSRRAWVYAPGTQAMYWDNMYETGKMGMGWAGIGDYCDYSSVEEMRTAHEKEYGEEKNASQSARMCFDFAHTMQVGDIIYAKRGRQAIIGRGIVTGSYQHDPSQPDQPSSRAVKWTDRGEWPWPDFLPMKTLTDVTDRMDQFERLFTRSELLAEDSKPAVLAPEAQQTYSIDEAMNGLFMPRERFEQLLKSWEDKKNLILQGAPGVGKSFIARRLAYALMKVKDSTRVRTVQFHQSYAYEDFVQGFRPTGTGFALRDGVFLNFCKRALEDKSDQKYVFIIDEINRGNLSKILGELMLLIEPDKRSPEWAVKLAYAESAEERFYVSPNVYILGMMNTADRSLAVVDYALRRRFSFATLQPCFNQSAFKDALTKRGVPNDILGRIIDRMTALNADIAADTSNLGSGYCIGHSFFVPSSVRDAVDAEWYENVVLAEILPLLEEYWFDQPDKVAGWKKQLLG
jgi:hypothetical protein